MRLDFNVLWVDDQPEYVQAQITPIAAHMETEGFGFRPTYCRTIAEVRAKITDNVFDDEVDLVLVDWELGSDVWGQNVIEEIRTEIPYKDVIFYSAHTSIDDLRSLASSARVDGVFCIGRNDLVDEVINVFDSLVKRVVDLDHTRGIVMGATSDIDHMVSECLLHAHGRLDDEGKKALVAQGIGLIDGRLAGLAKQVEELKGATDLAQLLEADLIFTAYDRLRMLSRLLKMNSFKAQAASRASVTIYMKKVVPGRNVLGHQIAESGAGPKKVVNSKGEALDLRETRELRKTILGLRSDFRALLAALEVAS